MKNHIKIDERNTEFGKFELWEHGIKGDTVPCIVTLNGKLLTRTYDTLNSEIEDYRNC